MYSADQHDKVKGIRQTFRYGGKEIQPKRIIHFCWSPVNGEVFGIGIQRSIAETTIIGENEALLSFVAKERN
jgi:hypothetical protein